MVGIDCNYFCLSNCKLRNTGENLLETQLGIYEWGMRIGEFVSS